MSLNLKGRVEAARREPSTENLEKMWQAVFVQRAWYLIPSGEGETHPRVIDLDGEVWLPAFTDFRRLDLFGREHGLRDDASAEIPMLVLAPPVAMRKIEEFAEHLAGVVFNPDSEMSFRAPVDALVEFAERFGVFEFEVQ